MSLADILKQVGLEEADRRIQEANGRRQEAERHNLELVSHLQDRDRQIERLQHFEDDVRSSRPERLRRALKANQALWAEDYSAVHATEPLYIDDPIYRQVVMEQRLVPILRHPIVQRLAHIKQLSFSHLTFPAATHSRLSHSLGASKNAEQAMTRILQKGTLYTAQGRKPIELSEEDKRRLITKAKVAGLLHDLGHGPFGHGLDQYVVATINENSPDKFYAVHYIKNYLAETINACGIDVDDVLAVLDTNRRTELDRYDTLISNLIDSPLDVDRMDYLVRDAHMTGLSMGAVNIEALIERMVPFEGPITRGEGEITSQVLLAFEKSAIPYITHVLYARDSMYLNCYEHPHKVLAERMLTKAVEDFREKNPIVGIDDLMLLTDEEVLKMLMNFSDPPDLARCYAFALLRNVPFQEVFEIRPKKYEAYEKKKKAQLDEGIEIPPEEEEVPPKPAALIANWEEFSLHLKERNLEKPRNWELKLAEDAELGEDSWKVVVTVPVKMVEPKFDDIKILESTPSGYRYSKLDRLTGYWESVLKHIGIERYSIKVFAASDLPKEKIDKIHQAATDLFTEP